MAEIGKINKLRIVKRLDFGCYLDGGEEHGEILIPLRYVPKTAKIGDELDVFIYFDSEDRIIATTEKPIAQVGECGVMEVLSVGKFGAFLDWGLSKDLLIPFKEQQKPLGVGNKYVVYVYIDSSKRIAASTKLDSHLLQIDDQGYFIKNQMVNLKIASRNDLGFGVVIDNTHLGIIHDVDVIAPIKVGDEMDGYIKKIRQDLKIDVTLQAHGAEARDSLTQNILQFIENEGGSTNITDKSSPEEIFKAFGVSKSAYKKAIGKLYKENLIVINKDEIGLV